MRDLRTCAESLGGTLLHYHDKCGLECDAVMRLENGSYGLIELVAAGDFAYRRKEDGIIVCPVGCIKQ